MEVCHHRKSEEDILASASFAARQLEYDTLLQASKCCLDGSCSSRSSCSNLLAIDTGDQKGAAEEHSKGSFHTSLEGWQNIFPSKERHDNFQLQTFRVASGIGPKFSSFSRF